jgi:hypothetical protein
MVFDGQEDRRTDGRTDPTVGSLVVDEDLAAVVVDTRRPCHQSADGDDVMSIRQSVG